MYEYTSNQVNDQVNFRTKHSNCNLFDPYTPFNCISCHEGYMLNIQTNSCVPVAGGTLHCTEYIDSSKTICIRCKKGYILDYGINKNIFEDETLLVQSPQCIEIGAFHHITRGDANCENGIIHNEYRCMNCKNGFYFDYMTGACNSCPQSNCRICSNKGDHRCLICNSGYHNTVDGSCVSD